MRKLSLWLLIILILPGLVSCWGARKTAPEGEGEVIKEPREFVPAAYTSRLYHDEGRYANLYTQDSFAVWVSPEVAVLKHEQAAASGNPMDPELEAEAKMICAEYLVFECHMASAFGDMSVAYDVVGFRNMDIYLQTPEGTKIQPIQKVIDPTASEQQIEALKKFGRANLLVFPRNILPQASPKGAESLPSVKLVLEGLSCRFFFEWVEATPPPPEGRQWKPTAIEAAQAAQMGFLEVFGRLKRMAHNFD